MNSRVLRTLAVSLLLAMAGCATGPFHRKVAPAPPQQTEAPELSQSPLYSPEMSENNPRLPSLPSPEQRAIVPPPPAITQKPHRQRKAKPVPASTKTPTNNSAKPATDIAATQGATPPAVMQNADITASSTSAEKSQEKERKQPAQQANLGEGSSAAASPIGELTAGSSADAAQTSHQAEDLIKNTKDGLDGIKRPMSPDEKRTATEIRTFLGRAQAALKNGDVDGAYGLATKAKLLLDELTQK